MNIAPIRKAVVAAVLGLIVTWLARVGLTVDAELRESIESVLTAIALGASVWLTPNTPTPDKSEED